MTTSVLLALRASLLGIIFGDTTTRVGDSYILRVASGVGRSSNMNTEPVPIYNKDLDLAGIGYIIQGEEDRGIQVRRMFTHYRIQSLKDEVALFMQLTSTTKEEAIMHIVRRIK